MGSRFLEYDKSPVESGFVHNSYNITKLVPWTSLILILINHNDFPNYNTNKSQYSLRLFIYLFLKLRINGGELRMLLNYKIFNSMHIYLG